MRLIDKISNLESFEDIETPDKALLTIFFSILFKNRDKLKSHVKVRLFKKDDLRYSYKQTLLTFHSLYPKIVKRNNAGHFVVDIRLLNRLLYLSEEPSPDWVISNVQSEVLSVNELSTLSTEINESIITNKDHVPVDLLYLFVHDKSQISNAQLSQVEKHLKGCDRCRQNIEYYKISFG